MDLFDAAAYANTVSTITYAFRPGEKTPPKFGDFEAQRHWMELAINVPARDWYRETADNDLAYWGLDYPPLSGYASWLAGRFLAFVDPASVALHSSRGYETATTRAAMRATVLIADIFVFFPALLFFARAAGKTFPTKSVAFVLTLPALIIIDHGHFQYNSVSLGLLIFSLASYLSEYDTLGAIFFCLSVYFKHMSLYYALALFALHLSRVVNISRSRSLLAATLYAARVLSAIAAVTVAAFWPWLSDTQSVTAVLRRLFPVSRGLYEDKVGNVWCSLSVVLKLKRLLSHDRLVLLCGTATVVASLPFCAAAGRRRSTKTLLLAVSGCALSAYLFAFQVHEKQILLPLVPLMLLFDTLPHALCLDVTGCGCVAVPPSRTRGDYLSVLRAHRNAVFFVTCDIADVCAARAKRKWRADLGVALSAAPRSCSTRICIRRRPTCCVAHDPSTRLCAAYFCTAAHEFQLRNILWCVRSDARGTVDDMTSNC